MTDRPGIVVSPHHLASDAGVDALRQGGNAVDAAIAANAVLGVVAPETCGIGGDLFALVWDGSEVTCLDASGWAGSGSDAAALRQAGHTTIPPFHPVTVTVPGCVAGWQALVVRHGRVPLGRLLEPALEFAAHGFPASQELSEAVRARESILAGQPAGQELLADGVPPGPGAMLVRPSLAATLTAIAQEGPPAFYEGEPARAITRAVGGLLSPGDLAGYHPEWVEPLSLEVFGRTAWTIPPASQGYLTVMAAALFERLDAPADPEDPTYTHLQIEAYRAAAAGRDDLLADRRWVPDAFWSQLHPAALARMAGTIDRTRAGRYPAPSPRPGGTAFLCALDGAGMGVSLIQSNFMGLGAGIGAAGFFLHNRGAGFDLRPGHPNELAPGKRPLHTLSPTLWTKDGALDLLLGTRGGHQQPQIILQMATALFHAGLDPAEAMMRPRWTTDHWQAGTSSRILVESRWSASHQAALVGGGHAVANGGAWERGWGPVSIISRQRLPIGVADPRVATASAATET